MTGLKPLMMAASLAFLVPAAYAGAGAGTGTSAGIPMTQTQMQGRIQQMQQVMNRIRATKNPRERQRLLQQHLREMRQAMSMICSVKGGMIGASKGKAMGHGASSTLPMNPCGMGSSGKGMAIGHGASSTLPINPCGMGSSGRGAAMGGKGARMSPGQMQAMLQRMAKRQQVIEMMMNQMVEHMSAQGGRK